jgi:Polymer-forming cytoskeletal
MQPFNFKRALAKIGVLREVTPVKVAPAAIYQEVLEISRSTILTGNLECECDVVVYGAVTRGTINAKGYNITLEDGSDCVDLTVFCAKLFVKGDVKGIDADVFDFHFDGATASMAASSARPSKVVYDTVSLNSGANFSAQLDRRVEVPGSEGGPEDSAGDAQT